MVLSTPCDQRKFLGLALPLCCLRQEGGAADNKTFYGYRVSHADLGKDDRWWVDKTIASLGLTGLQFSEAVTSYSNLPAMSLRVIERSRIPGKTEMHWLKLQKLAVGGRAQRISSVFADEKSSTKVTTETRRFEPNENQIKVLNGILEQFSKKSSEIQTSLGDRDPEPEIAIVELLLPDQFKIFMIEYPESQPSINGIIQSIKSLF